MAALFAFAVDRREGLPAGPDFHGDDDDFVILWSAHDIVPLGLAASSHQSLF